MADKVPSVGRIVLFTEFYASRAEDGSVQIKPGAPMAAVVARVWTDTCLNLCIFNLDGTTRSQTSAFSLAEAERDARRFLEMSPASEMTIGSGWSWWPQIVADKEVHHRG